MISTVKSQTITTTGSAARPGRKTAAQAKSDPFSTLFSGVAAAAAKSAQTAGTGKAAAPMAASPFGVPARFEGHLDQNLRRVFQTQNASAVR